MRQQLDDAADSVCRNIANGFGCGTSREFARLLRIAHRWLNELQDGVISVRRRDYLPDVDLEPARRLQRRLYPANAALLTHSIAMTRLRSVMTLAPSSHRRRVS